MKIKITSVARSTELNSRRAKVKVFFFPDEETRWKTLYQKPELPFRELKTLLPLVYKFMNLSAKDAREMKASWSRRAGCSCFCMPGFILSAYGRRDYVVHYSLKED